VTCLWCLGTLREDGRCPNCDRAQINICNAACPCGARLNEASWEELQEFSELHEYCELFQEESA
jgi:hypothetical protein